MPQTILSVVQILIAALAIAGCVLFIIGTVIKHRGRDE